MISCTVCLLDDPSTLTRCYINEDKDILCIEKGKLMNEALDSLFSEERDWFENHQNDMCIQFENNFDKKNEQSVLSYIKTLYGKN